MPEKEPQFTVTDRRKFTLEGALRDEQASKEEAKANSAPAEAAPERTPEPEPPAAPEVDLEEEIPEPSAEESARQHQDYQASSRQLDDLLQQANAGDHTSAPMNFERLVQSIYMTAAMQLGAGTAPNEQPRIDILGARQSIDMLGVLDEKTKGNLTAEEKRLLQNALFDLRMSFLEITNAIASSAQRRPKPGASS